MPTITDRIIRLTPSTYVHVCDNNTNITRVIVGPVTFTRMDHEEIVLGPEQLVTVPKGSYAVVTNPADVAKTRLNMMLELQPGSVRVSVALISVAQIGGDAKSMPATPVPTHCWPIATSVSGSATHVAPRAAIRDTPAHAMASR